MIATTELVSLAGRAAVVTGGAKGLGLAMATRLADAGAGVVIADIDEQAAIESARALGGRVVAAACDVTDSTSLAAVADVACAKLGRLDIWVSNAGIMPTTGAVLDPADEAAEEAIYAVNLHGTLRAARTAAGRMAPGSVIVNLSSSSAFRASRGVAAYASSKAAIAALTRNLAVELGPCGIRVLGVAPHIVSTPGTRAEAASLAEVGFDLERMARANPLRMTIEADHIARVVLFAVSDLAAAMTGSTLLVDAGVLA